MGVAVVTELPVVAFTQVAVLPDVAFQPRKSPEAVPASRLGE